MHRYTSSRAFVALLAIQRARFFSAERTAISAALQRVGINNKKAKIYHNLNYAQILEHEIANKEGTQIANGTYAIDTGKFTGRSPKDKFFVKQAPSEKNLWWGDINQPITPQVYDDLNRLVVDHYNTRADKIYVFDGYCGSNPASRKKVRFITEIAWQNHFVTNMFIRPRSPSEIQDFQPDFTIVNACRVTDQNWKQHGLNSEVFVAFNVERNAALIGGTWYGGEMKKGIFSMMNYWLPLQGIMPMHCSANKGKSGDTALFFGLSGTGKTTLSADPHRFLIGDDEHGWDNDGIFNFEGGCYAKTINLSEANEPDIYRAIKKDALLENVWIDEKTKQPDYNNSSKTQNGRVSYPLFHISNYEQTSRGGHPNNVVFLTCDAFGVLPPVAELSPGQAMYHFLSGYTAKVAGTERGVNEPQATFSACFGAAFLTLHPTKYADLLQKKLEKHNTKTYLVNTGWTGGPHGVGSRMSIKATRACIDAILNGSISRSQFTEDPMFGFKVPRSLPGVTGNVLTPRETWSDKTKYDETAAKLAGMFKKNFQKYVQPGMTDYTRFGPK